MSGAITNTVLVYAYEEDGEETGKTVRVDFLFTLKFDEAGKLKIVKTQTTFGGGKPKVPRTNPRTE